MDDCIGIALERNLELRNARTQVASSNAGISGAWGQYLPVLTVTADRTNLRQTGDLQLIRLGPATITEQLLGTDEHLRGGTASIKEQLPLGTTTDVSFTSAHDLLLPDSGDTPSSFWSAGFTQPLLRGGWWTVGTSKLRTARYDARITESGLQSVELRVVQDVKTAYYETIRQAKLVAVNQKGVGRDSMLVVQSQNKLNAGLATKRDLLSAEIVLAQDRGTLVDSQTAYEDALDNLAFVMGLHIGRRIEIAQKDVTLNPVEPNESAWVTKALRDNPVVREARLAAERENLNMHVTGNQRLPQLDLDVHYNKFRDADFNELTKKINVERVLIGKSTKLLNFTGYKGWTAAITLSYPLGNKALGSAHTRARLGYEVTRRNLDDAERQVTLSIRSAIRGLQNSREKIAIVDKNIEGARNKLEMATLNFALGRASNFDITEAQKDLLKGETDYVNAVVNYQVQLAKIESLVGGQ
jgi:outer membrane protein TolC